MHLYDSHVTKVKNDGLFSCIMPMILSGISREGA